MGRCHNAGAPRKSRGTTGLVRGASAGSFQPCDAVGWHTGIGCDLGLD